MTKRISDSEVLAQIPKARARARNAPESEPRAKSAYYDRDGDLIVVALSNGTFFGFPPALTEGLDGATAEQLAEVEVSPSGEGLRWEKLDADLLVSSLLRGVFGTKAWMKVLGQVGGGTRSDAKADAARENGKKGGRPRLSVGAAPRNKTVEPEAKGGVRTAKKDPLQQPLVEVARKASVKETSKDAAGRKRTR